MKVKWYIKVYLQNDQTLTYINININYMGI